MCGIAGILSLERNAKESLNIKKMMAKLHHRGPDGCGTYIDSTHGVFLGHTRLSILDLSESGKQPMESSDGRYVLTYNGEIYNYIELKRDYLSDHHFRSHSDTEVLLEGLARYGLNFLEKLNGMFAFCLYDKKEKLAHLVRDRLGVKPLYYTFFPSNQKLVFSSELKSILMHSEIKRELDPEALALSLRLGSVPAPWSIIKNVKKLPAAHVLSFSLQGKTELRRFWQVPSAVDSAILSRKKAQAKVARTLEEAIKRRLRSDVKVGAYLSGGVDSTIISALATKLCPQGFMTFSSSYDAGTKFDKFNDDALWAKETSDRLGIPNHRLHIAPSDEFRLAIEQSLYFRDEPDFAANNVAQFMISSFVKNLGVTVVLDGTGGDELFLGYEKYRVDKIVDWARTLPRFFWPILTRVHPPITKKYKGLYSRLDFPPASPNRVLSWCQFRKKAEVTDLLAPELLVYQDLLEDHVSTLFADRKFVDNREAMIYLDVVLGLPEVLNASYDRMSMANSVEVRSPFMDVELVELALTLPPNMKLYGNTTKTLLKDSFPNDILPDEIKNRPKTGWTSPVNHWVKNLFLEEIKQELHTLSRFPLFNQKSIDRHFTYQRGQDLSKLWSLFAFKKWWDLYMENTDPAFLGAKITSQFSHQATQNY